MDLTTFTNTVKDRLRLSAVVGKYIQLKPSGPGKFVANCPFHQERTPSFHVSDDRGFYYCYGCKASGDVFRFIQEHRHLDFKDAADELADLAGVTRFKFGTDYKKETTQPDISPEQKTIAHELLSSVAKYYQKLLKSPAGEKARAYCQERGIPLAWIDQFQLGYSPATKDLELAQKIKDGKKRAVAESIGLIRVGDYGSYDHFRGRLMFTITNARQQVVGFGGRAIEGENDGRKYVNSLESLVYKKSEILYGLSFARQILRQNPDRPLVIVEGYLDVLALLSVNIPAVAPLGTGFTDQQARLLRSLPNVCLAFDGDKSGQEAEESALKKLLGWGIYPKKITWGAKDPFEVFSKSPDRLAELVAQAVPALEMHAKNQIARVAAEPLDARIAVLRELAQLPLADNRIHWGYLKAWGSSLGLDADLIPRPNPTNLPTPEKQLVRPTAGTSIGAPRLAPRAWESMFWEAVHLEMRQGPKVQENWPFQMLPLPQDSLDQYQRLVSGQERFPSHPVASAVFAQIEFQREPMAAGRLWQQIHLLSLQQELKQIMGQVTRATGPEAAALLSRQIQINKLIQDFAKKGAHAKDNQIER